MEKKKRITVKKTGFEKGFELYSWYKNSKEEMVFKTTFIISKELLEADPGKLYHHIRIELEKELNKEIIS